MIDTLMDVISNGVIACCGVFALLAFICILFFLFDKFIIYIVKKVRERRKKDDEFEIR